MRQLSLVSPQVTVALEEKHTFNVAVAELMSLSNVLRDSPSVLHSEEFHQSLVTLCTLLAPMAPHMASELWNGEFTMPVIRGW